MITVACVRTGTKYGPEYVRRLRSMVASHLDAEHRFVCLTDNPRELPDVQTVNVAAYRLPKWWSKMCLFDPSLRGRGRVVYLDLDTVVCGDLAPLMAWDGQFGICANFARAAGHPTWPCRYGSCVMSFASGWGGEVFGDFYRDRERLMRAADRYGDQWVIERLVPDATLLQDVMPEGFFLNKRDLGPARPDGAAVVVFGGNSRPDNAAQQWVREAWA